MTNTAASQPTPKASRPAESSSTGRNISDAIMLVILVLIGLFAIYADTPPRPVPEQGSDGRFSAERAMKHVSMISRKPHPVGSAEHSAVRDYIQKTLAETGLPVEVQKAVSVSQNWGVAASVENVVARLQGSGAGKSVLLVAHYDSVPPSFGASDDGAGVATLLETARVLKSLPQPKTDITFLFTDGEEIGLLGAQAFVSEHPQPGNIGVVLNFEARGTGGPAILFETSNRNGSLMRSVGRTAHHPVANSLSYEIYKRLPNDTDFTVFKRAGYSGLNFAFIDGLIHYHTAMDTYQNLDPGSLQQEGDYAVDLAKWFGNDVQENSTEDNAVYFDILGLALVCYSSTIAVLLVAVAALLLAGVLVKGFRKGRIHAKGLSLGIVVILLGVAAAVAVSFAVQAVVGALAGGSHQILAGQLYNSGMYVAAFATLGLATALALYVLASKRIGSHNLAVAGLVVWFTLLLVTTVFVPGAGYLWLWPLLFALVAWNIIFRNTGQSRGILLLTLAAIPAVILMAPMIHKIFTAFSLGSHLIVSALLTLLAGLLVYQLTAPLSPALKWALPGGLCVLGLALLATALFFSPHFDRQHPRFDSIFYGVNTNTGMHIWASYDDQPDEWTALFLGKTVHKETLPEFFPGSSRKFLQASAEALPLEAPQLNVIENTSIAGERQVRVRVISPRHAPTLSFFIGKDTPVTSASVNGKEIPAARTVQGDWTLQYYAVPANGIDLLLKVKTTGPFQVQVVDMSFGLPDGTPVAVKERTESLTLSPGRLNNSTVVAKMFSL